MNDAILMFSYAICAFIPVLTVSRFRRRLSPGVFWTALAIGLVGSFAGGLLGTMLIARTGFDIGLIGNIFSGLAGAWLLTFIFFTLREMPENW